MAATTAPAGASSEFERLAASFRRDVDRGNPVRNANPLAVLFGLTGLAIAAGIAGTWAVAAIVVVVLFIVSAAAGRSNAFFSTWIKIVLFVGSLLFLTRAAFHPSDVVWFRFAAIAVGPDSIASGADFAGTVMAICGTVVLLFAIYPMNDLLLAMEHAGMSPKATYVVLASFQAITDLGRNSKTVMDAQRSRGVETGGGPITRMKAFLPVLAPVFLSAISSTEERAMALDARAFNASSNHSHLRRLRQAGAGDRIIIVLGIVAVLASIAWKVWA